MEMFEKWKPYIAMTLLQLGYAGMNIITKISLNTGMSHFVLLVYRQAVGTAVLAPFAFFIERNERPKLTFNIFCHIFALGLLGPVIDLNFYYLGLKYTSPTFTCAMSNLLPGVTFIMALFFRMERVNIREVRSQAKIIGTLVSVGGATLMTLYRGPVVPMIWSSHSNSSSNDASSSSNHDSDWIKGSLFLVGSTLAWASMFILQTSVIKKYCAQLSLATLICLVGTLQSIPVALAFERRSSAWVIGWDMNLLAAVYAGVVVSGIAYYLQGLCMRLKGPVFVAAFNPLQLIIVAIMDSIILSRIIYLGIVLGGALIAVGLYGVMWGQVKDNISTREDCTEMLTTENKVAHDNVEDISAVNIQEHDLHSDEK